MQTARAAAGIRKALALVFAGAALVSVWTYPLSPVLLGLGLGGYAALLWFRPHCWPCVVLPVVSAVDLSPWTGRFFWGEADAVLCMTCALLYSRQAVNVSFYRKSAALSVLLLFLAVFLAALNGLRPFALPGLNDFTSYLSPYNSLRVAKGFFWAILFIPLLRAELTRNPERFERSFLGGLVLGLGLVILFALWEHWVFVGFWDLDTAFRITGPFASMHVGGGHIEAFLALALPVLAAWGRLSRSRLAWFLAVCLAALGIYAMLLTYARGGYLALIVALLILLLGRNRERSWKNVFLRQGVYAAFLACVLALGLQSDFLQARFHNVVQGAQQRWVHWDKTLAMLGSSPARWTFGAGLGTFPRTYREQYPDRVADEAGYAYARDEGNTHVLLEGGRELYFGQRIRFSESYPYTLRLAFKTIDARAQPSAILCEKNLLSSFNTVSVRLSPDAANTGWQSAAVSLQPRFSQKPDLLPPRPRELSLGNSRPRSLVAVDNVSLRDAHGQELLANGDFEQGGDFWFFVSDDHLLWHVKNLFLHVLVEMGLLGLLAVLAMLCQAFAAVKRTWKQDGVVGSSFCASLLAFLTVGIVVSPFEAPRLTALFLLLCFFIIFRDEQKPVPPQT